MRTGDVICWNIRRREVTASTNADALGGAHGDVFTAGFQTSGRGRLDHRWLSAPGENLMMSAVLSVAGMAPAEAATLPLVAGLSVAEAVAGMLPEGVPCGIKWPNDVFCGGGKVAGILCERDGENAIVGIGVNVNQRSFAPEIAGRAASLGLLLSPEAGAPVAVDGVRDAVLDALGRNYLEWKSGGFAAVLPRLERLDLLKGRGVAVAQGAADAAPVEGLCGGIAPDGALLVGGARVYAGEAHVLPLNFRLTETAK